MNSHSFVWMHKTKDQLYDLIKDIKSKKEFHTTIKQRYKEVDGLFDEDTLALLIVDELGRNQQSITKITDVKPDTDCTVQGKVTMIHPSKAFKKKNGSSGKVINLEICDDTCSCRLVLWNEDAERVSQLKQGSNVKIINGYVKNGFSGIEINLGRYGLLEILPDEALKSNTPIKKLKTPMEPSIIVGILTKREPTRAFFKDNGEFGFVTNITIKDNNDKEKQLTLWGENVKGVQQFKIGEKIHISGVTQKDYNGKTEFHLNGQSMIQRSS